MDLATLVKHQGPLPVDVAVDYVAQAARGLTQLHLAGVFHRNLKPQSLLVDMQGRLRIGNLLLAKVHEASELNKGEELTKMGEMMGTVEYQPPEQAMNAAAVDGRSDIYALGCTLHFLLTGQPPYPGKSMMEKLIAHRQKPIPSLAAVRGDVSPQLDLVFQRMMAKEVAQRQQFVGDLLKELEELNAPPEPQKEIIDSYTMAITLGAIVIVGLVGILIWQLRK
jgi:serine/threonine protein kinase